MSAGEQGSRVGADAPVEVVAEPPEDAAGSSRAEDVLIVLPVRNTVLFPQVVLPIAITRERTVAGAQEAVKSHRRVGLLLQRDGSEEDPNAEGLHRIARCWADITDWTPSASTSIGPFSRAERWPRRCGSPVPCTVRAMRT